MFVYHEIKPKLPLDFEQFHQDISYVENLIIKPRGNGENHYYINQKSARPIDITLTKKSIEIRNPFLSNYADFTLTNVLVKHILKLTQGKVFDGHGKKTTATPLFLPLIAHEHCMVQASTAKMLCDEDQVLTIFGPIRKVVLDKNVFKPFKNIEDDDQNLHKQLNKLILKVNYKLPDYGYGDMLETTIDGEETTMKLLSNKSNYLVDYYDYILLHRVDQNPIMITNQILNQILPKEWKLVDALNIVAPIIPEASWNKLLERALSLDMWKDVMGEKSMNDL